MRRTLIALGCLVMAACKPRLYNVTVEERIQADAHKTGRLPAEALHCQVNLSGTIQAKVVSIGDDYTGVVHLRTTGASKPCDGDFAFRMEPVDAPSGTRRYSELDIDRWSVVELRPLASGP